MTLSPPPRDMRPYWTAKLAEHEERLREARTQLDLWAKKFVNAEDEVARLKQELERFK